MCCKYIYISHVGILGVKQIFRWYKKGTIRTEAGICLKGIQYKQNYKSFARIVLIVRNCMQSLQHRANSTIDPIRSSLIVKVSHISSSTSDDFIARFLSWKNPKNPLHLSIGISHQVAQHMYIHIYICFSKHLNVEGNGRDDRWTQSKLYMEQDCIFSICSNS